MPFYRRNHPRRIHRRVEGLRGRNGYRRGITHCVRCLSTDRQLLHKSSHDKHVNVFGTSNFLALLFAFDYATDVHILFAVLGIALIVVANIYLARLRGIQLHT